MTSSIEIMLQVLQDRHEELKRLKSNAQTSSEVTISLIRLDELEHIIEKIEDAIKSHDDFNTN